MKERTDLNRREFLAIGGLFFAGTVYFLYSRDEGEFAPLKEDYPEIAVVNPSATDIVPIRRPNARPTPKERLEQTKLPVEQMKTPESERITEIILTGDVMLGRTVMTKSLDEEKDASYPFKKVAGTLREADIVFINLENSIVSACPRIYEGLQLCAVPEMVRGLTYAGVDVVTLANNHITYSTEAAVNETREVLEENNILVTGLEELAVKTANGIKFGFLGFDFETKYPIEEDYGLIRESKPKVDILIVGVHWGGQYTEKPTHLQRKWAKQLVKEGADVVAGHGPHVVLDEEYIDNKPVFYSLGNFVFDQTWSKRTREGLVIRLIYKSNKLIGFEKIPIKIETYAQPEFVEGKILTISQAE